MAALEQALVEIRNEKETLLMDIAPRAGKVLVYF
jgi:hypothetical protein